MYVLAKKFGNEKISRKDGFSEVLTEGKESLFASSTRKFIGFKKSELQSLRSCRGYFGASDFGKIVPDNYVSGENFTSSSG